MNQPGREATDRRLFDSIATHYARKDLVASSSSARRQQLLWAIKPVLEARSDLGTIVDIGCGVGAPARYLAGRYRHYIGIDQAPSMIAAAQEFNGGNNRAEFAADNVKDTHLPPGSADVVLSVGALHHMTDLNMVMDSLVRIAAPGAYLVVIEPQNGNPLIQAMRRLRAAVDDSYSMDQIFFSHQELVALFVRHGLSALVVDFQGYLSPPFAQVILHPQALFAPLSRAACWIDSWLHRSLPGAFRRFSFNVVVVGRFPA